MNLISAIVFGIIEGLTEFIPVSSTAHLLIAQELFHIPADQAMFSFLVLVQLGALLALIVYYWKDLLSILVATLKITHASAERDLGLFIIIATIPALVAGYLLKDAVEALFRSPLVEAAIRLFAAAILLTAAEYFGKRVRSLGSMNWLDALIIGLMQILAVFPGASRSGATISGGLLRNFDRPAAARFAFLMSVPVMLAAGGYQMLDVSKMPDLRSFLPVLAAGFVAAAIVGWFAIRWLINYLSRHSLYIFAGYCAALGLIVLLVQVI